MRGWPVFEGKRVLAVCPARGGSKGLPRKNIQPVGGVPLVARVGHLVGEMPEIDHGVISTEDPEIADIAVAAGLVFHGFRPAALSGDAVPDWPVLEHELRAAESAAGYQFDIVLMLQPTAPLRRPEHVRGALAMLDAGDWDAVWTVSPTDSKHHPLKQFSVDADGSLTYYDPQGAAVVARQQLSQLYHRNGAAYAISRACLVEQATIKGRRTAAYVIDEPMISIDTRFDLRLCEFLLEEGRRQ